MPKVIFRSMTNMANACCYCIIWNILSNILTEYLLSSLTATKLSSSIRVRHWAPSPSCL